MEVEKYEYQNYSWKIPPTKLNNGEVCEIVRAARMNKVRNMKQFLIIICIRTYREKIIKM